MSKQGCEPRFFLRVIGNRALRDNRWALSGLLLGSFMAGALGGFAFTAIMSSRKGSTTTVTIEERIMASPREFRTRLELTAGQVYRLDAPGVVYVFAARASPTQSTYEYLKGEGGDEATATGSGFEIDRNGDFLTNLHVVEGATAIMISDEHKHAVKARVVEKLPSDDIAVIRATSFGGFKRQPLPLGDSNAVKVGDEALAIGNPFGLGDSLTTGVISGLNRRITAPNGAVISRALQTDAPVNPGNSGGPLINAQGEVIGINAQIETAGDRGGSVGIAFAIPINIVKRLIGKLTTHQ